MSFALSFLQCLYFPMFKFYCLIICNYSWFSMARIYLYARQRCRKRPVFPNAIIPKKIPFTNLHKGIGKDLSQKMTTLSHLDLSPKATTLSEKSLSPKATTLSEKSLSPNPTTKPDKVILRRTSFLLRRFLLLVVLLGSLHFPFLSLE